MAPWSLAFGVNEIRGMLSSMVLVYFYATRNGMNRWPHQKDDPCDCKGSFSSTIELGHNFTDGMALGSAFLLHGSVGGWSRKLFLLAHELPQEVGDFEILVSIGGASGNCTGESAALTVDPGLLDVPGMIMERNWHAPIQILRKHTLALILGQDPGQSSLIEENNALPEVLSLSDFLFSFKNMIASFLQGFTAGGFIYIAAAGVLPEINSGSITFKSTVIQLMALTLGMAVALCISLVE
ncbi:hypothetical protein MRB53_008607 [Persea americana]|uniref:Uncharacterized protein n=1 Tax=Persea americana TaxID=3435 RepID=A0ACC2MND5_PERAE|nr:hypothetical protein MRB53_008607 [Persea americana]